MDDDSLLYTLAQGGPVMIPLLLFSVLTIAVVIDRFLAFRQYASIDNRSLRSRVLDYIWDGDVGSAALICAKTPGPIAAVLLAGIQTYVRASESRAKTRSLDVVLKEAMDDYSIHAVSAVEKRLAILATIGAAAPLLGMTGTVTGMIQSFGALAEAGAAGGSGEVAAGISEALVTTATGLVIALMAVIPYNYFTSRADAIDLEIEEVKSRFAETITELEAERAAETGAAKTTPAV